MKRGFRILGTGHAIPKTAVSSVELDEHLRLSAGTVQQTSGVTVRYVATTAETAAVLAASAAKKALSAAGLCLDDIDCLVSASGTMDQAMPSNAALIHHQLGLTRPIPAFDINASCLGFLMALDTLSWALNGGQYRRILVVASDIASCGLDWQELTTAAIFGDGAAAAVISSEGPSRLLASSFQTYSEGAHFCEIPAGGSRFHPTRTELDFGPLAQFRMDGKGVFRLAAKHMPPFVEALLQKAGISAAEIDWIVPHQASHLAISHIRERLGFASERVINIFADYGNQVAASLPTALDIAVRDGRILRGHKVLMLGTGAGLSIGGLVLEF